MFVVEKEKGNAPCDEFCVPGKGNFSERRVLRLRKLFESQGEDSFFIGFPVRSVPLGFG